MKAMILAAGRGERLRPLTDRIPKVLADVAGKPLLAHQLGWLAAAGIREVVVNLHHLGQQIVDTIGDGSRFGVRVRYSLEPQLLETGGGVVKALPLLGGDPFLVLNGDIYTDCPLSDLPTRPPDGALCHLLVTPRPSFRTQGDFDLAGGRVVARGEGYVYCGVSVLDPTALTGYDSRPFSLRDVFFALMAQGALTAQVWDGYWTDIGSQAQLDALNEHHRAGM